MLFFVYGQSSIALLMARLLLYQVQVYAPPISLWGRLRTGRWIIPGYDQVFVTPLLVGTILIMLPWTLMQQGIGPDIYVPLTIGIATIVALAGPPSLMGWRLTGMHRIRSAPQALKAGEFIQVG
jgi:hypothetical protein